MSDGVPERLDRFEGYLVFEPGSFKVIDNCPVKLSDGTVVGHVTDWWRDGDAVMISAEVDKDLDL